MKKYILIAVLFFTCVFAYSQKTIKSHFYGHAKQQVKLIGFDGFETYTIDSTQANSKGEFVLKFTEKDFGMGYLMTQDGESFIVILAEDENLVLQGETLALPNSIKIVNGKQNQLFEQYASEHPRREQTLNVWEYLTRVYTQDTLFNVQKRPIREMEKEKNRIKAEDNLFLARLNKNSYLHWYLPVRKLVSSAATIAQYRSLEAPATLKAFRKIDYSDDRLYKSGLLKESIENHFWLIENSLGSLDAAYVEMYASIDSIVDHLVSDEKKLSQITDYLFKLLERRSLFKASEYLALKVLNQDACSIDVGLASKLESYRAMKVGNTAPDFDFNGDILSPGYSSEISPKKLSDINSDYTVLVFGSSWCPACPKELMQISTLYQDWKNNGVEVIFVSLDDNQELFKNFAHPFPFISISDYQKWESPIVKRYHVFATPTIFLLNNKREIILRPNSAEQVNAWIDWNLVQGNK